MGFFRRLLGRKKKKDAKYSLGLHQSREALGSLKRVLDKSDNINEDLYMEIEEILIGADIGVETTLYFMDKLREQQFAKQLTDPKQLQEVIVDELFNLYLEGRLSKLILTTIKKNKHIFVCWG